MPEYIIKEVALNELGELICLCREALPNENGHHYVTEKELLIGYDHLCNIPPEDVVPIIRCKDCSYWNDWDSTGKKALGITAALARIGHLSTARRGIRLR